MSILLGIFLLVFRIFYTFITKKGRRNRKKRPAVFKRRAVYFVRRIYYSLPASFLYPAKRALLSFSVSSKSLSARSGCVFLSEEYLVSPRMNS